LRRDDRRAYGGERERDETEGPQLDEWLQERVVHDVPVAEQERDTADRDRLRRVFELHDREVPEADAE